MTTGRINQVAVGETLIAIAWHVPFFSSRANGRRAQRPKSGYRRRKVLQKAGNNAHGSAVARPDEPLKSGSETPFTVHTKHRDRAGVDGRVLVGNTALLPSPNGPFPHAGRVPIGRGRPLRTSQVSIVLQTRPTGSFSRDRMLGGERTSDRFAGHSGASRPGSHSVAFLQV